MREKMKTTTHSKKEELILKLETSELDPHQVRSLKALHVVLASVVTAEDEAEYFEGAAELMKLCAAIIKQSHFTETAKAEGINYGDQAVEFAIDSVNEAMNESKVINFDN